MKERKRETSQRSISTSGQELLSNHVKPPTRYSVKADGTTGLGLAIVEHIAMEHVWDVTIADATGGPRFEGSGYACVTTID